MCLRTRLCPDAQSALVLCQRRFLVDEGNESAFDVRAAKDRTSFDEYVDDAFVTLTRSLFETSTTALHEGSEKRT